MKLSIVTTLYNSAVHINDFKNWSIIYNPPIRYSGYSVKDLWFI